MKVRTIADYYAAKAKGIKCIEWDMGDCEPGLIEIILNGVDRTNKNYLSDVNGLVEYRGNMTYTTKSTFTFGKHKNNFLGYVYKIDPGYLDWCMINQDGFVIHPDTLDILMEEPVYQIDDLMRFTKMTDESTIEIDLSGFFKSNQGFPVIPGIEQYDFNFSIMALNSNAEKVNSVMNPIETMSGKNFKRKTFYSSSNLKRKSIKIIAR